MMHAILLCAAVATISGASIDTIQKPNNTSSNVTKREILEFYPDWVPFKNKRGDELGEFVDVTKPKAKVKKRLALPMNFVMKVASEDSDDYQGQGGESDSDDYYDKKDWSDLHRPVVNNTVSGSVLTNTSDIDGVLNIITQETPSLADDIKKSLPKPVDYNQDEEKEDREVLKKTEEHSTTTAEPPEREILNKMVEIPAEEGEEPKPKITSFSDYEDEAPSSTKKPEITEEERRENEEKKKIILDSVDRLKLRHEEEQRAISEKTKEEEFDNEFRHKSLQLKKNRGRFDKRQRGKPTPPNYDEYEDLSWKDKYNINVEKKTTEPLPTSSTPASRRRTQATTTEKAAIAELSKYSVFRNPSLYIIEDDASTEKNEHRTSKSPRFSAKYSSAQGNAMNSEDNHVSSQTTATETVEPILYFPKVKSRRKPKRTKSRRPITITTTAAPDSSVAETIEDKLLKHTTIPVTYPDTTAPAEDYKTTVTEIDYPTSTTSLWKEDKSAKNKATTAQDTEGTTYHETTAPAEDLKTAGFTSPSGSAEVETSNTQTVTDAVPAPSHHAKEEPKDYHVEKGGGSEHHSSHEEEHEEHGKKAYETTIVTSTTTTTPTTPTTTAPTTSPALGPLARGKKYSILMNNYGRDTPKKVPWYQHHKLNGLHKNSKSKKGHHDKEDHLGKYEDHGGHDKSHHDEAGHYGAHHHEEHGKKHAKYEESGKHSKGHSTKGSHDIHKKEEYEKNVEFFEEEGDSGEEEKHGGYHNEKEHKSGGLFKRGNLNAEHQEKKKGESGHFVKGGHHDVNKGHKATVGHDSHGKHGNAHHKAGGHHGGKKWVYHHGFPAKNANLIVIDRRTDRYMHGPTYYG